MDAVYRRRRIGAAIVALVLMMATGKAIYEGGSFVVHRISEPTFICEPAEVVFERGDKIWNIADVHCEGNITDAAGQIMEDNGINGNNLSLLRAGTIITIKKGDK